MQPTALLYTYQEKKNKYQKKQVNPSYSGLQPEGLSKRIRGVYTRTPSSVSGINPSYAALSFNKLRIKRQPEGLSKQTRLADSPRFAVEAGARAKRVRELYTRLNLSLKGIIQSYAGQSRRAGSNRSNVSHTDSNSGNSDIATTILYRPHFPDQIRLFLTSKNSGFALIVITIGAFIAAFSPVIRAETYYYAQTIKNSINQFITLSALTLTPAAVNDQIPGSPTPTLFNPLINNDGTEIIPVDSYFSLVVPKIGINAPIVAGVNPAKPALYNDALKKGVAHAATSYYPNEKGTVYLFSHSTNYEWFIKDLNAIFYLLKNLEKGDYVVIIYLGNRYTYQISDKKIISPREISYIAPQKGRRNLILQTCWPPGSISKRLLVFADLVEEKELL